MNTVNVRGLEIGAGRPKIAVSLTGAAREDLIAQARALPGWAPIWQNGAWIALPKWKTAPP